MLVTTSSLPYSTTLIDTPPVWDRLLLAKYSIICGITTVRRGTLSLNERGASRGARLAGRAPRGVKSQYSTDRMGGESRDLP